MSHTQTAVSLESAAYIPGNPHVSPLVLADRLLTLAQDADRAGFSRPAAKLLKFAYAVLNEKPH
jgi:hypothetical protein